MQNTPWCSLFFAAFSLFGLSSGPTFAREARSNGAAITFKRGSFAGLAYRLHTPSLPAHSKAPLIVFLHGVGERGSDDGAQLSYDFFREPQSLFGSQTLARHPAFVLAPQVAPADKWIAIDTWSDPDYRMRPLPTPPLTKVLSLIDKLITTMAIDRDRVYVTGLSMGGFGTFDAVARRGDLFAAAVPICGRGDPAQAGRMKAVPFSIFQGARDKLVPATYARTMVAALKDAGATPRYQEYPDVGHGAWIPAYSDQEMIAWLFAQHKDH